MKNIKLSLVAIGTLSMLSCLNANTLSEALTNGKVSGELKSQFYQKESNTSKTVNIWTNGLNLSYDTADYNGLTAGVTFQAASVAREDLDENLTAYNADQNVSGSVLSQAYIQYKIDNTNIKVGRQYLSSPLIASSGSRIFKESFEAATLTNTDIKDTSISLMYVKKYQGRTDGNEGAPSFDRLGDGVFSIYATNKSIKNLSLAAQYVNAKNLLANNTKDVSIYYLNGEYDFNIFKLGAQYYGSDDNGAANNDGNAYALKASTKLGDLSLAASYSEVSKDGGVDAWHLGNGADYIYTWSWYAGSRYSADMKATKLEAGYKFTDKLSANIMNISWKTGTSSTTRETDFIVDYKASKDLSLRLLHGQLDNAGNEYQSRLYASYKF
ncbi:porin [Poseidonibacter ostreae]|uniref:Porin n=1 Tax=Poseidonibacter ostreae TaxID=2654171 RepID=A0A6L4WPE0_9BACT|nr:porin [Poseidonibacter ostreae]KAB7884663.1 porin [Poseidonibacter ostreae]KAB7885944.1 porin [Poseidonibacter ostreae]KAB7888597.1 porin [Poseidonibacter ostreae]